MDEPLSTFKSLTIDHHAAHAAAQTRIHPCLRVPELVDLIFRSFEELDLPPSLAALASLARTCRLFSEPALDVLWSRLPSIAPLLKLFPEEKWIEEYDGQIGSFVVVRGP